MPGEDQIRRTQFKLRLKVGDDELLATVSVPTAPIRPVDLLPVIQPLEDAVVDAAIEAVRREGKTMSCRAGCGACCRQLVPISHTEARYLAELVVGLADDRRTHVLQRFREAIETLAAGGLLDRLQAAPQPADGEAIDRLARDYFKLQVACPFLEDESCSIYPDRPLSCREYLVTSPAAWCQDPDAHVIEKVPLYAKPTQTLFRFDDGEGKGNVRWVPLVLSLAWAVAHREDPQPSLPGNRMFQNFLDRLAEQAAANLRADDSQLEDRT